MESVRVPCRPVIPKAATRTSAHLQTHTAHLTALHGTASSTLPEQLPGQQLCDLGVNRVPGHFSEGWQLLQSEALSVAPTQGPPRRGTRPLLSLPVPFSLRAHPLFSPALALPAIFSPALSLSLEAEMATRCSILAWRIPWAGEPGGLQSMGLQRVGHD